MLINVPKNKLTLNLNVPDAVKKLIKRNTFVNPKNYNIFWKSKIKKS